MAVSLMACSDSTQTASDAVAVASVFYETPGELIEELTRLQSGSCELGCQIAIAGMYSSEFLAAQRNAVMLGVANEDTREEMLRTFFGEQVSFEDLQGMSDQEFFARQLLQLDRTVPDDAVLRNIEIVSEAEVSAAEVRMVVVRSGAAADPDYEEEGIMSFVLEGGVWKIKN